METKFTPGPWRWSDAYTNDTGDDTWSLIGSDGYGVLSCDVPNSPQATHPSNAHLIAAAPEMYEKGAFKRNVIIHDRLDFVGEWIAVPREDFEAFQAERAKARGET